MPDPSQQPRYHYRGDLAQTALPEMLYTISLHRVPGVIEARRGEQVKRIFVREGAVIHAASSDRDDSLGVYLRRQGILDEDVYSRVMGLRAGSDRRLGTLLVEEDVLAPADLYTALQGHMRAIVWSLFAWQEGEVTFAIGDFEEQGMVRIHLPMRQVILEGVKRAPDARPLVARLGRKETVFEPSWTAEELVEAAATAEELRLLRLVDGKRDLYSLCTRGPVAPAENARLLYAFFVLRLVRRRVTTGGAVKIKFPNR